MRFSTLAAFGLLSLNACASGRNVVAHDDPTSRNTANEQVAVASAAPVVQGPVAVLGIPPGHYPPAGSCRVWFPETPPGEQRPPCSCFSLMMKVPAGAWVLYRPDDDDSVVGVTTYDASRPNTIVSVNWYDAASGKYLRSGKR